MTLLHRLGFFFVASAVAASAMALSLAKAMGEVPIRFRQEDAQLSDSQKAALMRELPRIEMLALESIVIEARFSLQPGHGVPTQALAKRRAAAIAAVFIQAGIEAHRVLQLVRPIPESATSDDASLDVVEVDWAGQCKPGSSTACMNAYFKETPRPPSASATAGSGIQR